MSSPIKTSQCRANIEKKIEWFPRSTAATSNSAGIAQFRSFVDGKRQIVRRELSNFVLKDTLS